jgi:serine/threonine protein kinase
MDLNEMIQLDEQTEEFGAGGTASIVKGRLKAPDMIAQYGVMDVAIKVINNRSASAAARDSFLYEVALMTAYPESEYLVKIIGYSESPMCIIMKFYPFSLKDILKRDDFENNVSISFKIAMDIAIGMSILHNRGIIHFDLKPGKFNLCLFV